MNIKDILTLVGGIMACVGPILIVEESHNAKLVGSICMSISGLLLGQRGLNPAKPNDPAPPALLDDIERRISSAPVVPIVPRQVTIERRYPEQPWLPEPLKSREELRAEQDAWLASNKAKQ